MHSAFLWALALGASPSALAFRDASPFMFFSTSELLFDSPQITTSKSLTNSFSSVLKGCPSQFYVLLHQPGVRSQDYVKDGATPRLQRRIQGEDKRVRSSGAVAEVRDRVDWRTFEDVLGKSCAAETVELEANMLPIKGIDGPKPKVIKASFPAPPAKEVERTLRLRENDLWLSSLIEELGSSYTLVYTTAPPAEGSAVEPSSYQMDSSMSPLGHLDLKRDLDSHDEAPKNKTSTDAPLFERYQYLTPGIFMGLLALFFLASILYVAISAVSSLQVSYAAFDKETGPSQQKKQQ